MGFEPLVSIIFKGGCMQTQLTRIVFTTLPLLGGLLLCPLRAIADEYHFHYPPFVGRSADDDFDDEDGKKHQEHKHEARKKALEQEHEARKKAREQEHEAWKKAEERNREAWIKRHEWKREARHKAREREREAWGRSLYEDTY
jgi:hypothetical protein